MPTAMRCLEPTRPRRRLLLASAWLILAGGFAPDGLRAQPGFFDSGRLTEFELAELVTLDRADTTVRTYLKRVRQYVADGAWDDALETLRRVAEQSGEKLCQVSPSRYITVRQYCQLELASLPPEGLARYRSQVDPVAEVWFRQAMADRNQSLLARIVERAFASSWADDALLALGDMALEAGDPATARFCWERIVPGEPAAGQPDTWLNCPDTDIDLAAVRARLVLASVLERSIERARGEWARLVQLHPEARGRLGGREVNYGEALGELLAEQEDWPPPDPPADWPTFGGSAERHAVARTPIDPAVVVWRCPLQSTIAASLLILDDERLRRPCVAERPESPLSYHPLVVGDWVLVNNAAEIYALDLATGRPAWGEGLGPVYRDGGGEGAESLRLLPVPFLGIPRFTMTARDGKLYARMGSPLTTRRPDRPGRPGVDHLVCLDLEAEGRLVWQIQPEERELAFDGAPVTDGSHVAVAMRRSEIQPQVHVACFDASTGRRRWQRFVCSGETPARGMFDECTHNLLTLHGDTLYVNTNLGAVAAVGLADGRLRWVTLYPRSRRGSVVRPDPHWCRDLTPCVYDRGTLLVAPADSPRIFALEAGTGQILWQTGPEVVDAVHLLGVTDAHLIASGHRLYWIGLRGAEAGRVVRMVPDSQERLGYGRGVLAGSEIWWPTREAILVFDQVTGRQVRRIPLRPLGVEGGNLVAAAGRLLIAGPEELVALGPATGQPPEGDSPLALNPSY